MNRVSRWMKSIVLFLCMTWTASASMGRGIYFKQIGKSEGLSQISVMSICQDEFGRMWFGTLEGINCYDGSQMRVFKTSQNTINQFKGNMIQNIVTDGKGNLFFTADLQLVRYDLYAERFETLAMKSNSLCAQQGRVWAVQHDSIFEWNREKKRFDYAFASPTLKNIKTIYVDVNNSLWVGTTHGLYRVENSTSQPNCIIANIHVLSLYRDSHKRMWVATSKRGMYKIENGVSTHVDIDRELELSNQDVRCFTEDNNGNIWVGTFNGLNMMDPQGRVTNYKMGSRPGELQHSSIFSLYRDRQGTVWVGTYYGGVHYFNPVKNIFKHYTVATQQENGLSFPFVGHMMEDKRGDLWICTEGGGLNLLNRTTGLISHYLMDKNSSPTPFYNLKCITYNPDEDCLYIGTHKQGMLCFDIATRRVKWHTMEAGPIINRLLYKEGKIYILSSMGLQVMTPQLLKPELLDPTIRELKREGDYFMTDSRGNLWVKQYHRLVRIHIKHPSDRETYLCGEKGLGDMDLTQMIETSDGNLYVGTLGSGLYRYNPHSNQFVSCSMLSDNYCYALCPTPGGYIAVTTDNGLLMYNPHKGECTRVDETEQLHLSSFNEGCGLYQSVNGDLFVGGVNGMSSFKVSELLNADSPEQLYFSQLVVNNQPVLVGAANRILPVAMPLVQKVELRHHENNFSVIFASKNYISSIGPQSYEYKLEGFSNEWITTHSKQITYTNLNPGRYRLLVRSQAGVQAQQDTPIVLPILIHHPWWNQWWAWLIYLAVTSTGLTILIRNRRARLALRTQLAQEKMEKEKNEEIIQAKLQFFANVSHEFRTPLTLIISQLEALLQSSSLTPYVKIRLQKIYRNTSHFRELISELLDFRKMERGKLTLHVSPVPIVAYLKQIYQDFSDQAQLQNLEFVFTCKMEERSCWMDARQLRKVFTNLLTNAFKFTPEGGKVEIQLYETPESVRVLVIDTGKGISEESINLIFERFYQTSDNNTSTGSGIGLALAKGLVEMHHGTISVKSAVDYGSIFTVELPKENPFTNDSQVVVEKNAAEVEKIWRENSLITETITVTASMEEAAEQAAGVTQEREVLADTPSESEGNGTERECILIVEDNEELLQLLTSLFTPLYKVSIAMNGKEGLEKAKEIMPDLVLSDVMMPVMDGVTMCRTLKSTLEICHIPVILLTALTSDQSKMEGLQCGADDYIEKPFNNKMLMGHVANMLRNRRLIKQKFSQQVAAPKASQEQNLDQELKALAMTEMDAKFLKQLDEIVQAHLCDSSFDVNQLASELALSRSSLYNKFKALSTLSPNEYILDLRLKRAAQLLKSQPDMQVNDIAVATGFNSSRYFRHCFKVRYNLSPLEYRES